MAGDTGRVDDGDGGIENEMGYGDEGLDGGEPHSSCFLAAVVGVVIIINPRFCVDRVVKRLGETIIGDESGRRCC